MIPAHLSLDDAVGSKSSEQNLVKLRLTDLLPSIYQGARPVVLVRFAHTVQVEPKQILAQATCTEAGINMIAYIFHIVYSFSMHFSSLTKENIFGNCFFFFFFCNIYLDIESEMWQIIP